MENKLDFLTIYLPMIIGIILLAIGLRILFKNSQKKRQYVSFREFMEVAQGYLTAEQNREGMSHLHHLDFALMHYEFYLNERRVDLKKVEQITQYRFRRRGFYEGAEVWEIENAIKRYL